MRSNGLKIALFAVLGGAALPLALGGGPPPVQDTQPVTSAVDVGCLVQITFGPGLPLDRKTMMATLRSSGVLGAAVRDVPGLDPDAVGGGDVHLTEFAGSSAREGNLMVTTLIAEVFVMVPASVPDARSKAEQLLHALCQRLEAELAAHGAAEQQRWRTQLVDAQTVVKKAEQRYQEVQAAQQELFAAAGQSELSRQAIVEELQVHERRQREQGMTLAVLHARQSALTEQIARIGREAAAQADQDPVVNELTKVVQLRELEFQRRQELGGKGLAAPADTREVEEALARARAELAKQRQIASQRAGGDLLADLNKELVTLAVDIAATEAEREFLRQRLAQVRERGLLELADRYEREVEQQLASAAQILRDALRRQVNMEERLASYRPPTVSVIGGARGR